MNMVSIHAASTEIVGRMRMDATAKAKEESVPMDNQAQLDHNGEVNGIAVLRKRARGKMVLLGFGIDRVAGVFTSVDKAFKELMKSPEMPDHNWWLSFRKADKIDNGSIFDRVLLRTQAVEGREKSVTI